VEREPARRRLTDMNRHRAFMIAVCVTMFGALACSTGEPGAAPSASSSPTTVPSHAPSSTAPEGTPDGGPGAPSGTPPETSTEDDQTDGRRPYAVRIMLSRSAGFVGLDEQVVVEPDGQWTYTTADGVRQTGRLTDSQLTELRGLATSRELTEEFQTRGATRPCADAYRYTLTVHETTMQTEECDGLAGRPTFAALVSLLIDATPL